jgi:FeoA domain
LALVLAGRRGEALKLIDELKARARLHYVPGSLFAEAYTGLGEKNRALGWMERAYEEQGRKLKHVVPLLRCRNVGHTTVPSSYSAGVSAFENGLLQAAEEVVVGHTELQLLELSGKNSRPVACALQPASILQNGREACDRAEKNGTVDERHSKLGELLDKRGVRPGSELYLRERNYDQTLSLETSAGATVLGRSAAEKIWVSSPPASALKG